MKAFAIAIEHEEGWISLYAEAAGIPLYAEKADAAERMRSVFGVPGQNRSLRFHLVSLELFPLKLGARKPNP